jgi:hypothetical protein
MTDTRDTAPNAASQGHTFVCYARHDEVFVLRIAAAMRDRGVRIWIDQWNIEPGTDWNRSIDGALKACSTFLIVLSPEAVESDEVRGELRAALNHHKRVIPVLYRPCEIPTRLLLTQYLDFTQPPGASDALLDRLAQVLRGEETTQDVVPVRSRDRTSRQILLEDLRVEARDRLRSIGTDAAFPITFEHQPHQVERFWDAEVGVPARQRPAPSSADIVAAFEGEEVGGRLLILGAPGSGKTTALLQLLQHLASRAERDESRPIPVLVSLVSWKNEQTIGEWLVDEVKVKYGVRADLGVRWRDERRIAPLFDGLDELPAERLHACVEAINEFQQTCAPSFLVVCCRVAEYENLTVKLRLRGAVCLLPLDADQVRTYLSQTGSSDLWRVIEGDPQMMEMARSPLLLSFMSGELGKPDVQRWQDAPSATARRQRILETYLSSHAASEGHGRAYSREQTVQWLSQLAKILKTQDQSEFLIERMQPEWLEQPLPRWAYRAGVLGVSAVVVALVMQTLMSMFGLVPRGNVGLALQSKFAPVYGEGSTWNQPLFVLIVLVIGSVIASRKSIVPVETVTWSWPRAATNSLRWGRAAAMAGLDYGTLLGVAGGLIWFLWTFNAPDGMWPGAGAGAGAAGAVCAAVFLARVRPSTWLRHARASGSGRRIVDALIAATVCALVFGWALLWRTEWPLILTLTVPVLATSLAVLVILAFSPASTDPFRRLLLKALLAGVICGAAAGALSRLAVTYNVSVLTWLSVWVSGGLVLGLLAGLAISLMLHFRDWLQPARTSTSDVHQTGKRTAIPILALGLALVVGVTVASAWVGADVVTRNAYGFTGSVRTSFITGLLTMVLGAISAAFAGITTAGILGLLAGALGGATGMDVERRLVPNQGIRQSAVNVLVFAALGVLIIGVPYGVFNLMFSSFATQTLPSPLDWLRIAVGSGATFGILAGLLPGAACIQHLVLRFVLWADGRLPLRLATFLNVATRRRLLQRVGGRYRFIHVLLRDHLGEAAQAHAPAWGST